MVLVDVEEGRVLEDVKAVPAACGTPVADLEEGMSREVWKTAWLVIDIRMLRVGLCSQRCL